MKGSPGVGGGGEGNDSQMSPPFLRTVVAKGLMWAGELSWAFSFLREFASKTATPHESTCSQNWDCLATGLLLCRLNHQGAIFSSHLLDLLLAFDRADRFLLEALCSLPLSQIFLVSPLPSCWLLLCLLCRLTLFYPPPSVGLQTTLAWAPSSRTLLLWGFCHCPYIVDSHFTPLPRSLPPIFAIMAAPLPTQTLPHTTWWFPSVRVKWAMICL